MKDKFYCHQYLSLANPVWENAASCMLGGSVFIECLWPCGRMLWFSTPPELVDFLEEK